MATSSLGASATAAAVKLCDKALAATQKLEEEAASLHSTNTECSQQLQTEDDLLKSAAATQDRMRATADALEKEHAQANALEQQAAALRERLRTGSFHNDDSQAGDNHTIYSDATAIAHLHSQRPPLSRTSGI
jgi:hypothetical protein